MFKIILDELKEHAPFTIFGAATGIVIMALFQRLPWQVSQDIFYVLHPAHVVFSALVTASTYEFHRCRRDRRRCNLWILLVIGYAGSIGIATLSDSLIPYLGEALLGLPNREVHLGFIERWWIVNPLAVIGITIAYFKPSTKVPHSVHVLLSTWASLFHIIMALGAGLSVFSYVVIFIFLFLAVWVPCCVSDIVFPLLFVKEKEKK
jgi:hypothetical protein